MGVRDDMRAHNLYLGAIIHFIQHEEENFHFQAGRLSSLNSFTFCFSLRAFKRTFILHIAEQSFYFIIQGVTRIAR